MAKVTKSWSSYSKKAIERVCHLRETISGAPSGVCPDGFTPIEGSVAIPRGGVKLPPNTMVAQFLCRNVIFM